MIRSKDDGGCGHEHPTPDEWREIIDAADACIDGFPWVEHGYSDTECSLIWMRHEAGAYVALLPKRVVYGPPAPDDPFKGGVLI